MAHSDKIALRVAEGMSHASNLSRNVAKSRGRSTFLATRNATIAVAKRGVTREFFLATCNPMFVAMRVARKIASFNMALSGCRWVLVMIVCLFISKFKAGVFVAVIG